MPEATGAGTDILHHLALTAAHRHDLTDVYEDFFPDPLSREPFQPEPGCSEPTFRGSDTDASALAGQLLGWGIRTIRDASLGYYVAPKSLFVARLPGAPGAARAWETLEWQNDLTVDDTDAGFQIRLCPAALQQIRSESLITIQIMGELVETGGMLLGRIDDACRVIWVTAASGPTVDSERARHFFRHGLAGVTEFIADQRAATRGRQVFVGMWHTHPAMNPGPSVTDLSAVQTLLVPGQDPAPRGVLAVFGGRPALWRDWLRGAGQPEVYARLYQTIAQEPRAAVPL
jgi:integrative and conjugative element protein (TIGR02256 family)